MSPPGAPSPRLRGALYALVIGLYVLAFPYHPGLRSPNELCRLLQTRALVEYGSIDLNQALREFDARVGDLSVKDGRYYPSKAPLLSFAAVPLYKVLSLVGGGFRFAVPEVPLVFWSRFFLTVLPTLVCLLFLRRFLLTYLSPVVTDALVVTYALGSLAFSYSLLFMSHQTDAVLLFGAFYSLWRTLRGDWRAGGYAAAGAFAGLSVAAEYTGALALLALVPYAIIARLSRPDESPRDKALGVGKALGLATLGALPIVVALMAYHQAAFGHPLHTGYKYLADEAYQPWHIGGFLGIRFPDPRAFILSFFSPLRGFFALAPFLALALPGLYFMRRQHVSGETALAAPENTEAGALRVSEAAAFAGPALTAPMSALAPTDTALTAPVSALTSPASALTTPAEAEPEVAALTAPEPALFWLTVLLLGFYAYFTSSFSYDSWGWTSGPRHMTGLVPFLLLPAGIVLERLRAGSSLRGRVLLGGAAALCAGSILVTGAITFVNYVPGDVSGALFGLALPLLRAGYLPPNVLNFVGVPNPAAAVPLVLALLVAAAGVAALLLPPARPGAVPASLAAVLTLALFLGLHALGNRSDDHDAGAVNLLKDVWLAKPGASVAFWPPP